MRVNVLKGKIHGARITAADLHYEGSIVIDESLLEMSGIIPHEHVHVWNVNNGNRLETYAIPAPPNSGTVMLNGAAARFAQPGDKVIITAFCDLSAEEAKSYQPRIVLVGDKNQGRLK